MAVEDERGFLQGKDGEFKHRNMIGVDKLLEDELVENMVASAVGIQEMLKEFKIKAFAECYALVDLLRVEYDMERIHGKTGSVTLKSLNGTMEVQIQVAKLISFDNKLQLAKEKIDEYLTEKTENADPEIQTLITRAFDVKNGKVDAKQIIGLKQYKITNPLWIEAMKMIDDATEIAGTKSYIRFKAREGGEIDGAMRNIPLDIASIHVKEGEIIETVKIMQYKKEILALAAEQKLPEILVMDWKAMYKQGLSVQEAVEQMKVKLEELEEVE